MLVHGECEGNWDDEEGYYCFRVNELLHNRYLVKDRLGRGVFSSVLRAIDTKVDICMYCTHMAFHIVDITCRMRTK